MNKLDELNCDDGIIFWPSGISSMLVTSKMTNPVYLVEFDSWRCPYVSRTR